MFLLMHRPCWCADPADALILMLYWFCWCADVLMLLSQDLRADLSIAICSCWYSESPLCTRCSALLFWSVSIGLQWIGFYIYVHTWSGQKRHQMKKCHTLLFWFQSISFSHLPTFQCGLWNWCYTGVIMSYFDFMGVILCLQKFFTHITHRL